MSDSKIIMFQGKQKQKSEAYIRRVQNISLQIQQLAEAEDMDTGNVLMDVTYMTVAREICQKRDEPQN